jgi:flagellar hook-length control protein FliK
MDDSSDAAPDDLATPAIGAAAAGMQQAAVATIAGLAPTAASAAAAAAVTAQHAAAAASADAQTALLNGAAGTDKHSRDADGSGTTDAGTSAAAGASGVQSSSPTTSTDPSATATLKVPAAVDSPEFAQGLSDRVSYMVENNLGSAKLQLNPPQLGPIEVRIAVQGDHAIVSMISHSAVTRDALESSSPKLREMLGSQGFAQVSVDISQRSFQDRTPQSQPYEWTPATNRSQETASVSAVAPAAALSSGIVDAYA